MSARYPRRAPGLALEEAGGAWMIRDAARGRVHYLNAAAALALELCTGEELSGGVTTHLMDPGQEQSYFTAWSPSSQLAFGYVWRRADFPWLGVWEENRSRTHAPWNALTLTRGMEFGVSPVPETRKQMIERGKMFDTPGYRWIPARSRIRAEYHAGIAPARTIPDTLDRFNALILPT